MAAVGRMVFLTFDVCVWEERAKLCLVGLKHITFSSKKTGTYHFGAPQRLPVTAVRRRQGLWQWWHVVWLFSDGSRWTSSKGLKGGIDLKFIETELGGSVAYDSKRSVTTHESAWTIVLARDKCSW